MIERRFRTTLASINPKVVSFKYAVRGRQAILAEELEAKLSKGENLPFSKVTACNIGNPQQLHQKPITFFRQVAACMECPELISKGIFPVDVGNRAKELLAACKSIGAYSNSQGIPLIRKRVASFISERDGGVPCDPDSLFLTAGASPAVQSVLMTLIADEKSGIMIPIPQYPLYTATISLFGGKAVQYYLNEADSWQVNASELARSLESARKLDSSLSVKALCVINPGNPTGQCLSRETMEGIVNFCHNEGLALLADEVYQTNVYTSKTPFISFKKVVAESGKDVELYSFHSISKGMIGECGRRGGYLETFNVNPEIKDMLYKIASVSLCPPVSGQIALENMVNPPKPNDPSFSLYKSEIDAIYESLKRRAVKLEQAFNSCSGISCNAAEGAMYLFPSITIPPRAIEEAKKLGMAPDEFYSMELLKQTGICVISGTGFGQVPGTWHFRSTFLPPEPEMDSFIESFKKFHQKFLLDWN